MKKKNVLFCIVAVALIVATILGIIFLNKKADLSYQLEVVNEVDYMLFSENNKFGVINKKGEVVVQALYDEVQIPNPSKPLFVCLYGYDTEKNQYKIKVLNDKSEQVLYQYVFVEAIKINPVLNDIPYEKSVLKYMQEGKYGLIDFQGNIVAKAQYEEITGLDYREGLLKVKKNGKFGVINMNGKTVIKCKYDTVESDEYFEEGVNYDKAGFIVGDKFGDTYKYGFIDSKGTQILKNKYSQIERITNKKQNDDIYLVAFDGDKAGLFVNNKNVIKNKYEDIAYDETNNCLVLQEDSKQGISDLEGNVKIDIKYDNIFISGKYINAQKDGEVDIYNYPSCQIEHYENVVGLNQTNNDRYTIAIMNNDKYKLLDNENNQLKDAEFDYLEYVYGNYYIASNSQKYGVVDMDGNEVIELKYDFIQQIPDTKLLQAMFINEYITDIIAGDKVVSSMKNCDILVKDDYVVQQSNDENKYIGYDGSILKNTQVFDKQLYAYEKDGKWGFININDDVIVSLEYDFVTEFNEYGFAGIKKDGKWGVININGDIILEPSYDIDLYNPKFVGKFYEKDLGYGVPYFTCENI